MDFDVVVIGGGPAGCSAAVSLLTAGYSTCVITRPNVASAPGEGVTASAMNALAACGFAPSRLSEAGRPWVGIDSCWGGADAAQRDFIASADGQGWHVDRAVFDDILRDSVMAQLKPGQWIAADRISVSRGKRWTVLCSQGGAERMITARSAIDASGRARTIARTAGAVGKVIDKLVGWHGTVACSGTLAMRTIIEAEADGWWYASPLPGSRAAICFLSDADLVRGPEARNRANLGSGRTIFDALGADPVDWQPQPRPSGTSVLDVAAGDSWAAVGDAAIAHDPLSGQGIDFAVRSGRRAAAALAAQLGGNREELQTYSLMVALRSGVMMVQRSAIYRREIRWPDRTFWRRRHGHSPSLNFAYAWKEFRACPVPHPPI